MDIIIKKAFKFHQEGKLDEAEHLYREILKIEPEIYSIHYNLGLIMQNLGRLDEAELSYQKVIALKPEHPDAYNSLGIILYQMSRLDKAEVSFKKAIEIKPNFIEAHINLGALLEKLDRLDEAEVSSQIAIKFKPDSERAHNNLGVILHKLGKLEEAEVNYKKAIKIKPDYAEAYNNLGNTLSKLARLEEAEVNYKKAIKIKPDYAEAYNNLGVTQDSLSKLEEAEVNYKKAIKIKPDHAEAYNNLGNIQYDKGHIVSAIDSFKQAINIQPGFNRAWINIRFAMQTIKPQISSAEDLLLLLGKQVTSKYSQIEKYILSYRLNLGSPNTESSFNEVQNSLSFIGNTFIKNPKISSNKLIKPTQPKQIVALMHFGRSGSGLLHSLIDGHSEVSTLPSIYFKEFFDKSFWKNIIAQGWEEMADRFANIYEILFNPLSVVPAVMNKDHNTNIIGLNEGMTSVGIEGKEVLSVNKKNFIKELKKQMDCHDHLDALIFFKLIHSTYEKILHDSNEKKIIFYHIHSTQTEASFNFLNLAPKTNWLMMIREPLQNCESWISQNFKNNDYKAISGKIFQMIFDVDQAIFQNNNSLGVKLEDLKKYPKKTITALCSWLGIKEKDSLYQMTAQGKKWWGDPTSPDYRKDGMNAFGKTSINRKLGQIFSKNDQFILRTLFYPISVHFGYAEENLEQFKKDLKAIRPMLDQMFDFEKKIAQNIKMNTDNFMKTGSYLYLRSGMIERWSTLNKFHTYPNMLTPLKIN